MAESDLSQSEIDVLAELVQEKRARWAHMEIEAYRLEHGKEPSKTFIKETTRKAKKMIDDTGMPSGVRGR